MFSRSMSLRAFGISASGKSLREHCRSPVCLSLWTVFIYIYIYIYLRLLHIYLNPSRVIMFILCEEVIFPLNMETSLLASDVTNANTMRIHYFLLIRIGVCIKPLLSLSRNSNKRRVVYFLFIARHISEA